MKHFMKVMLFSVMLAMGFSVFAQNGAFIRDLPSPYSSPDGAKYVNPRGDLLIVDPNPAAKTLALTYQDGSVDNWVYGSSADFWAVRDRFVSGYRHQGNDFFRVTVYGTSIERLLPYPKIRKVSCAVTQPGGGAFYTATITLVNGATVISNGYTSDVCGFFD